MSYSLYDTIRSAKYENSVILTFSLNLNLYESIIWRRLHINGCYNNLLFVDGHQFNNALLQDKQTLEYLGRGYVIYPIHSISSFHPKIILLTNKSSGKLIISSANITIAAFTRHSELINEFNYDDGNEEFLYLFNDCWDYIIRISQGMPDYVKGQIEQINETTPWLKKTGTRNNSVTFISFPNHGMDSELKIFDVLSSIIGKASIKEMTVLSPFFDSDLRILKSFKDNFNIRVINIIVDHNTTFDPLSKPLLSKGINIYHFSIPLDDTKTMALHGKALYLRTAENRYLLCGSTNFTSNALGMATNRNNYEAAILYQLDKENYYEMIGLADIVRGANKITTKDLKFEKRNRVEKQIELPVLITWAEQSYDNISVYLQSAIPSGTKRATMIFYDSAGRMIGKKAVRNVVIGETEIFAFISDKDLLDLSTYLELCIEFKDGTEAKSNKTVINKIELLREATAKSDFVKKLKKLNRIMATGQHYEGLIDLLRYFLFDSYEQSIHRIISKKATIQETDRNDGEQGHRALEDSDVISTESYHPVGKGFSIYEDQGGDLIKEIFLNTFLRSDQRKVKLIADKLVEDYAEEKKSLITEEQEQEVQEEEENEEEKEKTTDNDEEKAEKKRDKNAENRLLKQLVKKYADHLNTLNKYSNIININIENEFVRHYIALLMILKGAEERYRLFSDKNNNIYDDIIFYSLSTGTSLINKQLAEQLKKYISLKKYQHEEGLSMGLCSILTSIYLVDSYLKPIFDNRFNKYDLRQRDMLWISNRLLLMSFIYSFREGENDLKDTWGYVENYFNRLKQHSSVILKDVIFSYINKMVKMVNDIIQSIDLDIYVFGKQEKRIGDFKKGSIVVTPESRFYVIKRIEGDSAIMHGGIDYDWKSYKWNIFTKSDKIILLPENNEVNKYFGGLLDPNKSFWYLI